MHESLSRFPPGYVLSAPISFRAALGLGSGFHSSRPFCKDSWSALSKDFALTFYSKASN